MFKIVDHPIDIQEIVQAVNHPSAGGIDVFLGITRNNAQGRQVLYLEYEAYPEMAEPAMRRIATEAIQRWPGVSLAMAHRIGRVDIGEASVVIAAAAPHRAEAFAACRYAIDQLKATVPIWKKEFWEGGDYWVEGVAAAEMDNKAQA
ncbi:MAG: molybdenum cofactor biosynthesis protein MoaE [Chloroflexi bacterium]|nr:molybdenum cofactor biosynthesis protein MoaE [Chloroflexota bacterium]